MEKEKTITRYVIKVKKYIVDKKGKMLKIGEELIETDSSSTFGTPEFYSTDIHYSFTLEFVNKKEYVRR